MDVLEHILAYAPGRRDRAMREVKDGQSNQFLALLVRRVMTESVILVVHQLHVK